MPYWLKNLDKVLTDKVPFRVVLGKPSCVAMKYNGDHLAFYGEGRVARLDIGV